LARHACPSAGPCSRAWWARSRFVHKFVRIHQVLRLHARQRRQPCHSVDRDPRRLARVRAIVQCRIDFKSNANAPSANYDLAALPLSYTGPRCRTLCDSLASYNQNLSRASEFRDHCWMFRLRLVNPCRRATAHTVSRPRSSRQRFGAPSAGARKYFESANRLRLILQGAHESLSREPLFSSFDQATVPSSLRTSAWRTLRRQARAMRRNGLHIARLSRGIRVCSRRAMGRQPRRASQG
jgi:hypothetical protein